MNPKVDIFLNKALQWQDEMKMLRRIILGCGLTEELKWGKPCYSYQNNNIVIIQGFKEYCSLLFFKGVLLNDPDKILIKTGENTYAGRQVRFTGSEKIAAIEPALKTYIKEAIEVEKAGLKIPPREKTKQKFPEEFDKKLNEIPVLKTAFEALTPGRQRAYLIHFAQPKQPKTRESRIEKWIPQILNGKGLNE